MQYLGVFVENFLLGRLLGVRGRFFCLHLALDWVLRGVLR